MPLLVFIGTLAICHVVLIYSPLRLTVRAWKQVDYVWLTMSVISILGLVSQTRQLINANYIPWAERRIKNNAEFILDTIRTASHLTCDFPTSKTSVSPTNFEEAVAQETKYCRYLHDLKTSLQDTLVTAKPIEHDFAKDTKYPLAYGYDFSQPRLEEQVRDYNGSLLKLNDVRTAALHYDAELALGLLAPFLIAIALALRITKVTAELRPERMR